VNLVPDATGSAGHQFSHTKLKATLGNRDLTKQLTLIRTEIHEDNMITILELSPKALIRLPQDKEDTLGIMVSVDTINADVSDFWNEKGSILDRTHDMEKSVYFDTLSDATLASLGPVYE
jgi:hypothetical protein